MDKAMTVFAITRRLGAMSLLLLGLAGCGYADTDPIAAADGRIIAGADYSVPRGGEVEGLLRLKVAGQY